MRDINKIDERIDYLLSQIQVLRENKIKLLNSEIGRRGQKKTPDSKKKAIETLLRWQK